MVTVSVVMTTHNAAQYLRECVDSIRRQTYSDFEFLIVDDGSTDTTPAIIDDVAQTDRRVCAWKSGRIGRVEALNFVCGKAAGKFLAIMDADDVAVPTRLAHEVAFLESHPEVSVVGGAVRFLAGDRLSNYVEYPPLESGEIAASLRLGDRMYHPTVMMLRSAFQASGGYRKAFTTSQDYDLYLRLVEHHRFANLPEVLLYCREHGDRTSTTRVRLQALTGLAAQQSALFRAEGQTDPYDALGEVTEEALVALGISRCSIREAIVEHLLERANKMSIFGFHEAAQSLAADALEIAREAKLRPAVEARVLLLGARLEYRRQRPWGFISGVSNAALRDPLLVVRWVAGSARRAISKSPPSFRSFRVTGKLEAAGPACKAPAK